jgi:glutaconate CoA-transferase subunit B
LLRFEPDTKEMILVSVHPGVTADTVLENTAWPLKVAKDLMSTPAPTETELAILARFDPQGFWTGT